MSNIIKIENIELTLTRESFKNPENIQRVQHQIDELKSTIFDFTTKEGVRHAKELKSKANAFVKELKEFCEPLEAEGKAIADIRSSITTRLVSGKNNVIDEILKPIAEREEKIKAIKAKLFLPSVDAVSNSMKLAELAALDGYDWLAYNDEASPLIAQQRNFLENEKIKFDAEAKAAAEAVEQARIERENQIRAEAEAKVKADAQRQIDEANRKAEQARIDAERKLEAEKQTREREETKAKAEEEARAKNIENQRKIHNEILEGFIALGISEQVSKEIVKAIAQGKISHLKIEY